MNITTKARKSTADSHTASPRTGSHAVAVSKTGATQAAERLAMHRKAVAMIAGLWKDRKSGPIDGVDYQLQIRDTW